MYKYFVIYNILFITFFVVNTIPALKVPDKTAFDNKITQADKNKTNPVISEGGSIISTNPLTLNNENHTLFKNLDSLSGNKEKSVVPRKGVEYNPAEDIIEHDKVNQTLNVTVTSLNVTNSPVELSQPNKTVLNDSSTVIATEKLNITKIHKPLILSHEALVKMDEINHLNLDENGPDIKVHSKKAGSHPGMIMPIVITILVVPMFAVVGYMALKRGREAWKNRHYKRMDFLLDGMYND
ncbi:uncharacterized protein LOC113397259 [Vanessa tameamea]|uniref:Uncharacterized protein LOC113397259 n=1 Tax=Vanessa tameamea TaxID=334116 RepID=A0A8B8I4I7_VANTA|nr:uncharacterized protein LOC113397259 [Vanessa tameamea]